MEESILEHASVAVAVGLWSDSWWWWWHYRLARGRSVHLRQHEAITVQPLGALGVELHEFVEKNVGNGCHTPYMMSVKSFAPPPDNDLYTYMGAPG